jgi:hypothetical protein
MSEQETERYRGESGQTIIVRYQAIPGHTHAINGLREVDEIVCGSVHLETLTLGALYLRVDGLTVNVWAHREGGRLSVTVEPDGAERIADPASQCAQCHRERLPDDNLCATCYAGVREAHRRVRQDAAEFHAQMCRDNAELAAQIDAALDADAGRAAWAAVANEKGAYSAETPKDESEITETPESTPTGA